MKRKRSARGLPAGEEQDQPSLSLQRGKSNRERPPGNFKISGNTGENSVQTVHRKKHTRCQRNPRGFHQHLVLPCGSKMFNYRSLFNPWGFVTTRVYKFGHTKLQITKVRHGDAAQDYSIVTFTTEQEPLRGSLFFLS